MDILNALKQIRDDIKTWVTNNLNALNAKIDEKTIPIDSELSNTSTNPVQNKTITNAINNIPKFSGDYNDLTNAPDISEDGSGNMVIADESGNIIFKADADGIHTTALSLNGKTAATEDYVNEAIEKIPTPDVSGQIEIHNVSETAHADIRKSVSDLSGLVGTTTVSKQISDAIAEINFPETDLSNHYTKPETDAAIETAKTELSESIVAESDEWKVVDEAGNIILSVDATGAHTTSLSLNGEDVLDIMDEKVASLVNSAPEALDTLNELASALGDDPNFATTIATEIGKKVDKVTGKDLSTNDFTDAYKSQLDNLATNPFEETDPTVPAWAKEPQKPTYTAAEIGLDKVNNTSDADKPVSTATQNALDDLKAELSESITSETDEWKVVDDEGNVILSVDASGAHTTALTLNGEAAATEQFVRDEIGAIEIPKVDLSNYYDKEYIDGAIEELSESIVSKGEDLQVVDGNGNVVFVADESGVHTTALTLNGEVAATEQFVINAIDAISVPKQVQADFAQSDPSAPDFIKNKTHGETITNDVISNETITVSQDKWSSPQPAVTGQLVGDTYTVTWDGAQYVCQSRLNDDGTVYAFGNNSIYTSSAPNTGEPFYCTITPSWDDSSKSLLNFYSTSPGDHTVSVTGAVSVINKLDIKYAPQVIISQDEEYNDCYPDTVYIPPDTDDLVEGICLSGEDLILKGNYIVSNGYLVAETNESVPDINQSVFVDITDTSGLRYGELDFYSDARPTVAIMIMNGYEFNVVLHVAQSGLELSGSYTDESGRCYLAHIYNTSPWQVRICRAAVTEHTHKFEVSSITDLSVTARELNFVKGATSNIQTQINTLDNKFNSYEFITPEDIDAICGTTITVAEANDSEVTF